MVHVSVTIHYDKQCIKMKKKKSHFNNYGYHDALDPIPSFCLDSIY